MEKVIWTLAFLFLTGAANFVYAEPEVIESWKITSVEGEVFEVSDLSQTITVKWLQNYIDLTYDQVVFKLSSNTRIIKGGTPIELADVNVGDRVAIRYYLDKYGFQKVMDVTVSI